MDATERDSLLHDFGPRLIAWQREHGRHDLPWQGGVDPYPIWLSEIMLQQTQVETVIPYFQRFMARFPDLASLAAAPLDDVLACWSGLGYYARGRNLHAAAVTVMAEHAGRFPQHIEAIVALPGIGRSTAAAISAFAFGQRRAILDGNVKRVLCRVFGVDGWPGEKSVENRLWTLAESLLPNQGVAAYTQGLMDLGATLCRRSRPDCTRCPFADTCVANRDGRQSELPAARPRKALPQSETGMLVLLHAGEVLLCKRPPSGIWGGLWSLPECAIGADPSVLAKSLGYTAAEVNSLDALSHTFSHFRLHIQPVRVDVLRPVNRVEAPGHLWLPLSEALQAALPTPVRKILQPLG